jgi:hypothetical protein
MAVHEAAAGRVVHGGGTGELRIWRDGSMLVCQITDPGCITGPLAGRYPAVPGADTGDGLRLASELCDLSELRSGRRGTTLRPHVRCG